MGYFLVMPRLGLGFRLVSNKVRVDYLWFF